MISIAKTWPDETQASRVGDFLRRRSYAGQVSSAIAEDVVRPRARALDVRRFMREENITARSLDYISETARLRFSPRFEDVRLLLTARGLDPQQMLLIWCEHAGGPDMLIRFALPAGTIAEAIMRKDAPSGRYTSIVEWKAIPIEEGDENELLAQRITTSSDIAAGFSKAVASYDQFRKLCR